MIKLIYLCFFILYITGCVEKKEEKQEPKASTSGSCDFEPKNKKDIFIEIDGKKVKVITLKSNDCYISLEKSNELSDVIVILNGSIGSDNAEMKIVTVLTSIKKITFANLFNNSIFNFEVMINDHNLKKVKDEDRKTKEIKI